MSLPPTRTARPLFTWPQARQRYHPVAARCRPVAAPLRPRCTRATAPYLTAESGAVGLVRLLLAAGPAGLAGRRDRDGRDAADRADAGGQAATAALLREHQSAVASLAAAEPVPAAREPDANLPPVAPSPGAAVSSSDMTAPDETAKGGSNCDFDVIDAPSLTPERFLAEYALRGRPLALRGATEGWPAQLSLGRDRFFEEYADAAVTPHV